MSLCYCGHCLAELCCHACRGHIRRLDFAASPREQARPNLFRAPCRFLRLGDLQLAVQILLDDLGGIHDAAIA